MAEPEPEPVDTSRVGAWPAAVTWRALAMRLWPSGIRPGWHRQAACRDSDPHWWDGGRHRSERARQVCRRCPVAVECLADVLAWETETGTRADSAYGVAGGMTGPERRQLYRALPQSVGIAGSGRRQR